MSDNKTKSVQDLIHLSLIWKKTGPGDWRCIVDKTDCFLSMNDFPEEPLYTVTFRSQSLDLEEAPPGWSIEWDHK